MSDKSLLHIYNEVAEKASTVYVVPLIRYDYPNTDYLYLLYKDISDSTTISVQSISAASHFKLIFASIFQQTPILHYHWLEFQDWKSAFGIVYKLLCIAIFKALGGKMVWTVHNLYPHNKKWLTLHKKMYLWMGKRSDLILTHSPSTIHFIAQEYEVVTTKIKVVKHPAFPSTFIKREEAIRSINQTFGINLTADIPVIGSFGAISAYKKLPEIIKMVSKVPSQKQMLVAGYVKKGMQEVNQVILNEAANNEWLHYKPGFISEKLFPELMNAFDICVFNYSDILTSGGIEMALSYNKTVLLPRLSALTEYESNEKVHFFETETDFVSILTQLTTAKVG